MKFVQSKIYETGLCRNKNHISQTVLDLSFHLLLTHLVPVLTKFVVNLHPAVILNGQFCTRLIGRFFNGMNIR